MLPSPRTYAFWLALFRIYLGGFWIEHALGKVMAPQAFGATGGMLSGFLGDAVAKTTGPYHDFLTSTVIPHTEQFGFLVEFGELAAGVLLVLGLFTRLGGFVGAFLALNYWAAKGGMSGGFSSLSGLDMLTAVASALNLVLPTGRFLGLDGLMLRRRAPATLRATPVVSPPPGSGAPPLVTPPPLRPPGT
jgi:thiosulfate dehydrogenase [quinone] large subunit